MRRTRHSVIRPLALMLITLVSSLSRAADGTWSVDASGNWGDATNWFGGQVANGDNFTANFTKNITGTRTITLDTARTIGTLIFSDFGAAGSSWVLSGPSTLTLDRFTGTPRIILPTDATITSVLAGNEGLQISGGAVLWLSGANTYSGSTTIAQGSLRAADGVGLPSGSNLVIGGGQFKSSGMFTRALGTGANQVRWTGIGGFSAFGGPLTVRIGGNTNTLIWGSTANFVTSQLDLSDYFADNLVDFQNDLNLNGTSQSVMVMDNPSSTTDLAQISGAVSNGDLHKVGTGTLVLTGANSYNQTFLSPSALQIGNGGLSGTLGTGKVGMQGQGAPPSKLVLNRSNAMTIANTISGGNFGNIIAQNGAGTTTLSGDMSSYNGTVQVNRGALVLDYATNDSSKVGLFAVLTIGSATLELTGGSHQEVVGATSITGAASITRVSGTAKVRLNALTITPSASLDIAIDNIADSDTINTNGVLPGVTVGGQLAKNSTNTADGAIIALAVNEYTNVNRLGGVIADSAATNVKIVEAGGSGPVTLGSTTTNVNTITQSATGSPATIDLQSNTLRLAATGTVIANSGQALAFSGGTLTAGGADNTVGAIQFINSADVTVGSTVADNGTAAITLAKSGSGKLNLNSPNTYTGKTIINRGTVAIAAEDRLGANPTLATADQLTLNGGALQTTATMAIDDINRGVTLGLAGGTFSPDSGTTLTIGNNIAGTLSEGSQIAALTKTGDGELVLTGANSYGGGTTVSAGTLLANNTSGSATGTGAVTVNAGGTLGGTGTICGWVSNDGTISPGASTGTLNINGDYAQSATSKLRIELASASSFDTLIVSGTVALAGTLELSILDGYLPVAGTQFDILDFTSSTGIFDSLNLPSLDSSLAWDAFQLYSHGILRVLLAGDFNADNVVDTADYVVWRRNNGSPQDYNVWRTHFGNTSGSNANFGTTAPVPEPTALVILLAGAFFRILRRPRR